MCRGLGSESEAPASSVPACVPRGMILPLWGLNIASLQVSSLDKVNITMMKYSQKQLGEERAYVAYISCITSPLRETKA